MNIDNLRLRLNMICQGKVIALSLELMLPIMNIDENECSTLLLSNARLTHHIYSNVAQLNDSQQVMAIVEKICAPANIN